MAVGGPSQTLDAPAQPFTVQDPGLTVQALDDDQPYWVGVSVGMDPRIENYGYLLDTW